MAYSRFCTESEPKGTGPVSKGLTLRHGPVPDRIVGRRARALVLATHDAGIVDQLDRLCSLQTGGPCQARGVARDRPWVRSWLETWRVNVLSPS